MDDDFNTAAALGRLFDAVRALNRLAPADPAAEREKAGRFLAGYAILEPLFGVLGLLRMSAKEYFQVNYTHVGDVGAEFAVKSEIGFTPGAPAGDRLNDLEILRRIEERKGARARKDFAEADRIRKELDSLGVLLEDSKAGTTWKFKA
jgi:cysteinyl-tRNA synthetase